MTNPLDRAAQRRAARVALRNALAGLAPADALALLEDALADMYSPRAEVEAALGAVARPGPGPVPGMRLAPVESVASRIIGLMQQSPDTKFTIEMVAAALAGVDRQQIRSELNRQARKGVLKHLSHGSYCLSPDHFLPTGIVTAHSLPAQPATPPKPPLSLTASIAASLDEPPPGDDVDLDDDFPSGTPQTGIPPIPEIPDVPEPRRTKTR